MLELAEGKGGIHGVRGERENKCHHESLGHWETRRGGTGIKKRTITSFFLRERAYKGENQKNWQEMKQKIERASFVGHGCPTMCFSGDGKMERTARVDHCAGRDSSSSSSHSHHHLHLSSMPTELPYAADAEDSLSYDELQVRHPMLMRFWGLRLHPVIQVLRLQYQREVSQSHVTVQTKFNYAWGLIKSPKREHQVEGVGLLQGYTSPLSCCAPN